MITIAQTTVPIFVTLLACVSHASNVASVPDMMFKALFKALRTDVLEVHERFGAGWLCDYRILLSKKSVNEFEELLVAGLGGRFDFGLEGPAPNPSDPLVLIGDGRAEDHASSFSGKEAAPSRPGMLIALIKILVAGKVRFIERLLVRYAIFKTFLYGSLGTSVSKILRVIFEVRPGYEHDCTELGRFIDRLAQVDNRGGMFLALTAYWSNNTVSDVCAELRLHRPYVLAELAVEHVKGDEGRDLKIPQSLFEHVKPECQYYLATKFSDLEPYYNGIDWYNFYILSRFSRLPSERIRKICLQERPKYLAYEGEGPSGAESLSSVRESDSDCRVLPKDIWFLILMHLDHLSQIYVVPAVCTLWKSWYCRILAESPAVQQAFERDHSDRSRLDMILRLECYPWNHFLTSYLSTFRYLICQGKLQIENDSLAKHIVRIWKWYVGWEITESEVRISPNSYFDLYLGCCKAIGHPLVFYQLPGMSDKDYAGLIRALVGQHNIVPIIPDTLLEGDCGRFVQMLGDGSELIIMLLQDKVQLFNKLVAHLFSAKSYIPPKIAAVLDKKSTLYQLLLGNNDTDGYFTFTFQDYTRASDRSVLAHNLINLCILMKSGGGAEAFKLIGEGILKYYCSTYRHGCFSTKLLTELGIEIMMFLYKNRKKYSEGELSVVEQFFERCEIWNETIRQDIFVRCVPRLLSNSRLAIKLTR